MIRRPPSSTLFPYTTLFRSALQDYHWPGNVRELQNNCERAVAMADDDELTVDRKSTRLNSSHGYISYAVFCLKKKITKSNENISHDKYCRPVSVTSALTSNG